MLNGLLDLSAWQLVVVTLLLTHVTIAAAALMYARWMFQAALDLGPMARRMSADRERVRTLMSRQSLSCRADASFS